MFYMTLYFQNQYHYAYRLEIQFALAYLVSFVHQLVSEQYLHVPWADPFCCTQAAYVNGLQGSVLFDTMFEEDTDKDRISLLPDVLAMLNE